MVGKIDLCEGKNSYVLKVFLNSNDALPFMLFHCSYIDRPKEEALTQALEYKEEFSKTYNAVLEDKL